ncbi:MAG: flagellar motor switch protein FliM [Sphingopyxis sp.]
MSSAGTKKGAASAADAAGPAVGKAGAADGVAAVDLAVGDASPAPYQFGVEAVTACAALPALDRMSERVTRRMRALVEPFTRAKIRVLPEPVRVLSYGEWQTDQPDFTSLSLYNFVPLKGMAMLSIPPVLVRRMVDACYGGTGGAVNGAVREFTPTEERLLFRLSEAITNAIADGWAETVPAQFQLRTRETNVAFAALVRPEESIAVAAFGIIFAGQPAVTVEMIYPFSMLRAVEKELAVNVQDDAGAPGAEWREKLARAVGEVRMDARTVLARPELSMAELMNLKVGDIIPISLPAQVPLIVHNRQIAIGTIGDHDGHAALKIEKLDARKAQ